MRASVYVCVMSVIGPGIYENPLSLTSIPTARKAPTMRTGLSFAFKESECSHRMYRLLGCAEYLYGIYDTRFWSPSCRKTAGGPDKGANDQKHQIVLTGEWNALCLPLFVGSEPHVRQWGRIETPVDPNVDCRAYQRSCSTKSSVGPSTS